MAETKKRLDSLDVFRGLTIASMLIVNNPGSWSFVYEPLDHASWNGCTPTDLIFPFFLFIVGVAIKLSLDKKIMEPDQKGMIAGIVRRSLSLYGLGLILASWTLMTRTLPAALFQIQDGSWFHLHMSMVPKTMADFWAGVGMIRLTGVLQRIAFCYLAASLIYIKFTRKTDQGIEVDTKSISAITAIILVGYFLVMTLAWVPGFGMGHIDSKEANLAAYIDRIVLGKHIWAGGEGIYDPEGILSTFPAIATSLTGILCGCLLRRRNEPEKMLMTMFAYGTATAITGYILSAFMPFNKALWSSPYVLWTTGLGMIFLAFCYWYTDYMGFKLGTQPFLYHGTNAITVFFLSGLFAREISLNKFLLADGKTIPIQKWFFTHFCQSTWWSDYNASLIYAICFISFWTFLMWLLYRKKIFIKI
ncbi:MAG: DUF5009 domain-containing protein [Candidatus Wallbacteria bacterium]|nr:DUF5009 domain-containing protein [Candidatus Wallbacteria bacterium]